MKVDAKLLVSVVSTVGPMTYTAFKYAWNVFAEQKRNLKSLPHYSFRLYMQKKEQDEKYLQLRVKRDLPGFDFDSYNIAICGLPDTGKSALVNSLRRLKAGDKGAAPEEQTTKPGCYIDAGIEGLFYWDMPAIDGDSPSKEYFEKYHLYAFDYVLFLKSRRPQMEEKTVLKNLQEFGQSTMLVVSKADELLRAGGDREDVLYQVTQALKADTYRGFDSCLVSKWGFEGLEPDQAFSYGLFDEDKLQKDILTKVEAACWERARRSCE